MGPSILNGPQLHYTQSDLFNNLRFLYPRQVVEFEFKECKIGFFYLLTIRQYFSALSSSALKKNLSYLNFFHIFEFLAPSSYEKHCRLLVRLLGRGICRYLKRTVNYNLKISINITCSSVCASNSNASNSASSSSSSNSELKAVGFDMASPKNKLSRISF